MNFTQKQIEERYNSLPQDLRLAMDSVEVGSLVADIGDKNGLLLDQTADLMDQTSFVILGLISPARFSSSLPSILNIDSRKASNISTDINNRIFSKIRSSLQNIQAKPEQNPPRPPQVQQRTPAPTPKPAYTFQQQSAPQPIIKPSIEQAGRFTIEKPPVGISPQYKNNSIEKNTILKGIEDPVLEQVPMIDHLLTTPTASPETVENRSAAPVIQKKPKPVVDNKPYTVDPYREEI